MHQVGRDRGFCVIYPVDSTLWTSLLYKQEDTLGMEGMLSRAVGALCVELVQNTIFDMYLVSSSSGAVNTRMGDPWNPLMETRNRGPSLRICTLGQLSTSCNVERISSSPALACHGYASTDSNGRFLFLPSQR
jgi:hypothetical protein